MCQYFERDAAHQQVAESGGSTCTHANEISVELVGRGEDLVSNIPGREAEVLLIGLRCRLGQSKAPVSFGIDQRHLVQVREWTRSDVRQERGNDQC